MTYGNRQRLSGPKKALQHVTILHLFETLEASDINRLGLNSRHAMIECTDRSAFLVI